MQKPAMQTDVLSGRRTLDMKSDIIYLKLEQNSQVTHKKILLEDVADILSVDSDLQKESGKLVLYTFKGDKKQKLTFSALKVIALLQKQHPNLLVENIGETDFIVEYQPEKRPSKFMEYFKAAILGLIVFFGSAFTIMTFNTDVSVGEVFSLFYKLVMGTKETRGSILEISYSIGIAIGILGFYNHFSARNERDDPTPLHIEMRNYEEEMNKAIIKNASREGKEIT
jgi:stage V sporulation protein AA